MRNRDHNPPPSPSPAMDDILGRAANYNPKKNPNAGKIPPLPKKDQQEPKFRIKKGKNGYEFE